MVADIGDVTVARAVNGRLVRAAPLQVVGADEAHVLGLGRIADLLRLRRSRRQRKDQRSGNRSSPDNALSHESFSSLAAFLPAVPAWRLVVTIATADRLGQAVSRPRSAARPPRRRSPGAAP